MGAEKTRAVIDADFFIKLAQYDKKAVVFQKIMDDLNIQPVMHEYVARKEIKTIPEIQDLIQEGKIIVLNDTDYITDENREDYEEYFKQAYEIMNHYEFPDGEDIYTYECPDESLGEIRSIFMVKILGGSLVLIAAYLFGMKLMEPAAEHIRLLEEGDLLYRILESEIRNTRTPLPILFGELSDRTNTRWHNFFLSFLSH